MRLRTAVPMMLLLLLCACGAAEESAQIPVALRTELSGAGGCSFLMELKADYEEYTREFSLACQSEVGGETSLTVLNPEHALGIQAVVSGAGADVSYEDTTLAVEDFSSRRISPMAAPYLLTAAWSEGYIEACGRDGELDQATYQLGYGNQQLKVTTWFREGVPVRAEISDGTHTLITCSISEFTLGNDAEKRAEDNGNSEDVETDMGGGAAESSGAQC